VTTPSPPTEQDKARRQMMAGAMAVMAACVFGGLTAVVLMALGQRMAAGIIAVIAGFAIVIGIAVQISAARKLKAGKQGQAK
jgi:hypothetical protein